MQRKSATSHGITGAFVQLPYYSDKPLRTCRTKLLNLDNHAHPKLKNILPEAAD
jgi:hypothetical protein